LDPSSPADHKGKEGTLSDENTHPERSTNWISRGRYKLDKRAKVCKRKVSKEGTVTEGGERRRKLIGKGIGFSSSARENSSGNTG